MSKEITDKTQGQAPPFTTFNFDIEIKIEGIEHQICEAAFSECDGLEITMEPKTIREGGNNLRQFHVCGPVSYGTLTLKRGMTSNFDLWDWFNMIHTDTASRRKRADAEIIVYAADGSTIQMKYILTRCLPVKLKVPALNARETAIAIEEMQIAYETLELEKPRATGFQASVNF